MGQDISTNLGIKMGANITNEIIQILKQNGHRYLNQSDMASMIGVHEHIVKMRISYAKLLLKEDGVIVSNMRGRGYRIAQPENYAEEISKSILRATNHIGSARKSLATGMFQAEQIYLESDDAAAAYESCIKFLDEINEILPKFAKEFERLAVFSARQWQEVAKPIDLAAEIEVEEIRENNLE